jgi:hypothetical protein
MITGVHTDTMAFEFQKRPEAASKFTTSIPTTQQERSIKEYCLNMAYGILMMSGYINTHHWFHGGGFYGSVLYTTAFPGLAKAIGHMLEFRS